MCAAFDCAHAGDLVPGCLDIGIGLIGQNGIYRDTDYVRAQLVYSARIINGRPDTPDTTRVDFEKLKGLFADTPVLSGQDWATFSPPLRPTTRTNGRG